MTLAPPNEVVAAIEEGVTQVTRRIEITEADGETLWYADFAGDPDTKRLVTGSVNVDYNSDERRKADVTLRNDDQVLRLNPRGGFYYDKIIKLYRGVTYSSSLGVVRAALIDYDGTAIAKQQFMQQMAGMGLQIDDLTGSDGSEYEDYSILVAFTTTRVTNKAVFLKDAYARGKRIITVGNQNTNAELPFVAGGIGYAPPSAVAIVKVTNRDHPLVAGPALSRAMGTTYTGWRPTSVDSTAQIFAADGPTWPGSYIMGAIAQSRQGGMWLDYHVPHLNDTDVRNYFAHGVQYIRGRTETSKSWECQLGEFMIDSASDDHFPYQIKLTLRDYTKKLLKDKLEYSSTFAQGTSLYTFIRAIAANGGITKMRLAVGDEAFPHEMSFERGTERWKMIKDACIAFNYECFFDNQGYLVVRPFLDPTLSPISFTIATGRNLVNRSRSVNDGRIFNIARVYGDPPSGSDILGFYGSAINDDPNSPTSTVRIGKRPWEFIANYFTSDEQCRQLAQSRLSILALESYEVNYASLYYPWLEAGEIIEIIEPNTLPHEPTRFLNDTLSFPLDLGPMAGTAKRVTLVGSSGTGPL